LLAAAVNCVTCYCDRVSVCPSVCLSQVRDLPEQLNTGSHHTTAQEFAVGSPQRGRQM